MEEANVVGAEFGVARPNINPEFSYLLAYARLRTRVKVRFGHLVSKKSRPLIGSELAVVALWAIYLFSVGRVGSLSCCTENFIRKYAASIEVRETGCHLDEKSSVSQRVFRN